jgi:hypothetical protein
MGGRDRRVAQNDDDLTRCATARGPTFVTATATSIAGESAHASMQRFAGLPLRVRAILTKKLFF